MPPQTLDTAIQKNDAYLNKSDQQNDPNGLHVAQKEDTNKIDHKKLPIVWRNVYLFIFLHLGALYGVYCCFYAKSITLLFGN